MSSAFLKGMCDYNYIKTPIPLLLTIGDRCTIILMEIVQRFLYYEARKLLTNDGMFFLTIDSLVKRTGYSKDIQSAVIKKLVDKKLITQVTRGMPPRRYFSITKENELEIQKLYANFEPIVFDDCLDEVPF